MKLCILFIFTLYSTLIFAKGDGYLFVGGKLSTTKKWIEFSSKEKLSLKHLFQNLAKSKTGRELIRSANKRAKSYGKTLYDVVLAGKGSITDTTLIRRFSPSRPDQVSYETRSKVYINKYLNEYDALLDLAHELTHFVHRKGFNPYDKDFSLSDFIASTIEGDGGEVHAFMTECKVLNELFPSKLTKRFNCNKIIDSNSGKISRELAIKRFYSIGPYYSKFKNKLDSHGITREFPLVSNSEVGFVSSAYGMPYPVAAYHEYVTVLSKVCENDKKRIAYMGKSSGIQRSIASVDILKVKKDYLDRCSAVDSK
jgi:hypothetical protein